MNFESLYDQFHEKKQHGFCCPLFFLKTEDSSVIGEYPDLKKLADFAKSAGFSVIQLLPLFDTGPEASPYSARSCFALNPIFLSLKIIPGINQLNPLFQELYLNQDQTSFQYYDVYQKKMSLLREYFFLNLNKLTQNQEFKNFQALHAWLLPYSAFCVFREKTDLNPGFWDLDAHDVVEREPHEILFHQYLQFLCHNQLLDAANYAKSVHLHLMGDIPILLSPDSCEMWSHRDLFDLQLTVGSPPDQFSSEGQYWGFPMMRFVAKPQACAAFWRSRIEHASQYFSIYRIDHAVGFFRFWIIPKGKNAKNGYFFPADEKAALSNAKNLFEQLFKNSSMIPIAEDLGAIPEFVKKFFNETKLCGTKVLRWERDWSQDGLFIPLAQYPRFSMSTISTHDTTFFFDEWDHDSYARAQLCRLLNLSYQDQFSTTIQELVLKKVHSSASLFIINMIQEYFYLYPKLKDKLFRINDPRPDSQNNWAQRMACTIEEVMQDSQYMKKIRSLLQTL